MTRQEFDKLRGLVYEVLAGDVLELGAQRLVLDEQPDENQCGVSIDLYPTAGAVPESIQGSGVGIVDATFQAAKNSMAQTYLSLKHIFVNDFRVTSDLSTRLGSAGTDARVNVELVVRNESGRLFSFQDQSRSITASGVRVVLRAMSHFINAERAVRNMVLAIDDARARNRGELEQVYTIKLSELVKHASYSDVVRDVRAACS